MSALRQFPQTSSILNEGQKGVISESQKRVYIAYRAIFKGNKALIRQPKAITKVILNHSKPGQGLVEGLRTEQIVQILEELLRKGTFESEIKARFAFPDLFTTTLAQDAQHSILEADAAKSEAKVLKDIALLDNDQDEDHTDESDDRVPLVLPTDKPGLSISASDMIGLIRTVATPSQFHVDGIQVPSLYPLYFPYKAQHQLLSRTQRLLEECCYAFTEQWLPDVLEQRQWDCPEAIELNTWTYVVSKRLKKLPSHCFGDLGSEPSMSLSKVLISINDLRHAAVHRVRTTAKGISEMIRSATRFACALGGSAWEKQLAELQQEIDGKIRAMELNKNFLETKLEREMQDVARQRKELDEKEKNALTTMLREDKDHCASIGDLLSRSAERIFAGGMDDGLKLTEADQELSLETAEEKEPSLTVDHELPQQVRLDRPPEGRCSAIRDSSHNQNEPRSDSKVLQEADTGLPTSSDAPGEMHRGTKATEWAVLEAIGENNTIPQDARGASFITDSRVRDLEVSLDQETYAAVSEAVDSKISTYHFHSMCPKLNNKRLEEIHDFVRKQTKLIIPAYQVRTCSYWN